MQKTIQSAVVFITATLAMVAAQDCYFDFEYDTELQNFDTECNGRKGSWNITSTSEINVAAPSEYAIGDRVLTWLQGEEGCMRTINKMGILTERPLLTIYFFWRGPISGYIDLSVSFLCDAKTTKIDVLSGFTITEEGKWEKFQQEVELPIGSCKVEMRSYLSLANVIAIDRIELEGVNSSACYVVPKPTDPPETTTLSTTTDATTTVATSSSPTTADTTSTPTTTDTTSTHTTGVATSPPTTTDTTLPPKTTETTETTTTTSAPTPTTTLQPTPTISDPTTPTTQAPTTESQPTVTSSTTSNSDEPTTSSETTQTPPEDRVVGSSGFSMLYIVAIVGAAGGLTLISGLIFCCIRTLIPRVKKWKKKRRSTINKPFMPRKINIA